jgi:uncharacterized membrane protein YphA (DoxX/SURF4 family)
MTTKSFRKIITHPTTVWTLRFILGGTLLYAGWLKLIDMSGLAEAIGNYRILPYSLSNLPAILMPAVEIIVGICLIFGIWFDGALFLTSAMFATFVVAIESAIWRDLNIDCGCFSTSDGEMVGIKILLRAGFLFLFTIPVWMARYKIGEPPVKPGLMESPADSGPQV